MSSMPLRNTLVLLAMLLAAAAITLAPPIHAQADGGQRAPKPLAISVQDITTGQPITNGETIAALDQFQVTVTVANPINCAGQFVVSALGAKGGPPSVLEQSVPFELGPASGGNSVSGDVLTATGFPNHPNDWKISATCQAARVNAFAASKFEFYSDPVN